MQLIDPRLLALRDALPGQALGGSEGIAYHLREKIGEGGQGWVYKANWDQPGGFLVIVKVLRPDAVTRDTLVRFEREADVLKKLSHQPRPNPHIVRFFDHAMAKVKAPGFTDTISLPFTVLEYVNGPTLERVLAASRGVGLAIDRVRRIGQQVVDALEEVHRQKIVHRDLKPSNILLATAGDGTEIAKVTDFGLVKFVDMNLSRTTALAGASLGYAPPEQYEPGNQRVGPRTDVFSLAAILYEMLSGSVAFPYRERENPFLIVTRILRGPRPNLASSRDGVPQALRARPEIIERLDVHLARATSSTIEERHESVGEMWNAVDALLRAASEQTSMPRSAQPVPGAPSRGAWAASPSSHVRSAPPVHSEQARSSLPFRADAVWRWWVRGRPIHAGAVRSATFSANGETAIAAGPAGIVRAELRAASAVQADVSWATIPVTDSVLGGSAVRGVELMTDGDVLVYGEGGLVGSLAASGRFEAWSAPDRETTFLGALCEASGTTTLVGERPSQRTQAQRGRSAGDTTVGRVAQFVDRRLTVMSDAAESARLRAATRLRSGTLVACGDWGALVRLELGVAEYVAAVCGGHLTAIEALPDGGALTVGAGGHALLLSPKLEAQLEAVQTTRDLLCLTLADDGTAWAGAVNARLLRRGAGSWARMGGNLGISSSVVAMWAGARVVRAICDDGAVIEGAAT